MNRIFITINKMDPSLSLAVELATNLSPKEIVEVEYRYHATDLDIFRSMIGHIHKLNKFKFTITQQVDFVDSPTSIRIIYEGGKVVKKYAIKKNEHRRDKSLNDGSIVVATEEMLGEIPIINSKGSLCFIKMRLSFHSHNWSIDFTARQEIRNQQTVIPTVRMYFVSDIRSVEEYLDKCKSLTFGKYMMEIEHEIKHGTNIQDFRKNITNLVDEFNLLMQSAFAEDVNIEFTQLLCEAVSMYKDTEVVCRTKTIKGVTSQVLAFSKNHLMEHFPLNGWYVTDKPDGIHCLVLVSANGGIYALPDKVVTLVNPHEKGISRDRHLFEGELIVTKEIPKDPSMVPVTGAYEWTPTRLIIFEVMYFDENPVYSGDFENQLTYLDEAVKYLQEQLTSNRATPIGKSIIVEAKKFYKLESSIAKGSTDPNNLDLTKYDAAIDSALTLHKGKDYDVDGLIFVEPGDTYDTTNWYKWKPDTQNTLDFLAMLIPDQLYTTQPHLSKPGYDLYVLFVTASPSQIRALGLLPLSFYDQIFPGNNKGQQRPIHFVSPLMPTVHLFYYPNKTLHQKIIELSPCWYRGPTGTSAPVFAWKFSRIREDRQLDFESGSYYGNNITVAGTNFASFIYPTTINDLKGKFSEGYFIKNHTSIYKSLTSFNSAVKGRIFDEHFKNIDTYIDYAAGRADFKRYRNINKRVFAVDIDSLGLMELLDRHYSSAKGKNADFRGSELIILNTNLNNPYQQTLDQLIARKIPTRSAMSGGPINSTTKSIVIADGASCNMAAHYLVYTTALMANFVNLIKNSLRPMAKFSFTMMNGRKVYDFLQQNAGDWVSYENTIRKYHVKIDAMYPMPPGGSVPVSLILPFTNGRMITEHLIDVEYLIKQFEKAGFKRVEEIQFGDLIGKVGNQIGEISDDDKIFIGFFMGIVLEKK
jgi:hypothetical protein